MSKKKKMLETTAIKVDKHAEQEYQNMPENEIAESVKKIRLENTIVFVVRLILSALILIISVYFFTLDVATYFISLVFGCIFSIVCAVFSIKVYLKKFRSSDKELIKEKIMKRYIEDYIFDGKIIKSTEIIDSYTEWSNKLHGFLNYNEIIQTRICKFFVTFDDETTGVYDIKENSKEYAFLIKHFKSKKK